MYNNDSVRFKSIFLINMLSHQQSRQLQSKHKATGNESKEKAIERDDDDDDDTHESVTGRWHS